MAIHSNLISDSVLVSEAVRLLKSSGGRLSTTEIAEIILDSKRVEPEFAALFVTDLLADDPRFILHEDSTVELVAPDFEARKLNECDFIVFDTETTGAKAGYSRMTEIGAYRVKNGAIIEEFQTLVNPEKPIPVYITQLTGISNEMVRNAPKFSEIMPDLLKFLGDSILVAHNAGFDMTFLNYEIGQVYAERKLINANLCTVRLSRKLLPDLRNHRLHTIAEHYSIPIYNRHRAAGDALATAQIFVNFLKLLNEKGIEDIAALRKLKK